MSHKDITFRSLLCIILMNRWQSFKKIVKIGREISASCYCLKEQSLNSGKYFCWSGVIFRVAFGRQGLLCPHPLYGKRTLQKHFNGGALDISLWLWSHRLLFFISVWSTCHKVSCMSVSIWCPSSISSLSAVGCPIIVVIIWSSCRWSWIPCTKIAKNLKGMRLIQYISRIFSKLKYAISSELSHSTS